MSALAHPDALPAPPQAALSARVRHGRHAVAAALALGLLADATLRAGVDGVGGALWAFALVAAVLVLARRGDRPLTVGAAALAGVVLAFGAALAWRDAAALAALNTGALATALCALGASLAHGADLPLERAGPLDYLRGARGAARHLARGMPDLAGDVARVRDLHVPHGTAGLATAGRGALLAAPALLVFGFLFAAADPAFERLLARLTDVDTRRLASHLALAAAGAWGAGGYLYGALFAAPRPAAADHGAGRRWWVPRVRDADVCVALALVDALFAAFVLVQLRWLFGGPGVVASTAVTYAEYARRGFFELVTASALALPLLVAAHALAAPERAPARTRRAFRVLAALLLVLLGVVMLSAADRMRLYQAAYGLTELRVYASACMAWLAAVFAWAAATLLRDRAAPFALGTLVLAWAGVLALDALDPAALVARANTARAATALRFDAVHAAALGADAVPTLVTRTLPALARHGRPTEYCTIAVALLRDFPDGASADWRTTTWSRARARRVVQANAARLQECAR